MGYSGFYPWHIFARGRATQGARALRRRQRRGGRGARRAVRLPGAVRALTDARFRDKNSAYVRDRFEDGAEFCILTRVTIVENLGITPDWTTGNARPLGFDDRTRSE